MKLLVLTVMVVALATIEVNAKAEPQPYWGHPYGFHPAYFGPKCDEERCDSCMKDFAKPVNCRRECLACKDCKGEDTDDEYCDYCKDGYFACTRTCAEKQAICHDCAPECNMPKCDEDQCMDCMEKFPEPIFANNCFEKCGFCKDCKGDDSDDEMCKYCKDGFYGCTRICEKMKGQCLFCAPRCAKPEEEKEE